MSQMQCGEGMKTGNGFLGKNLKLENVSLRNGEQYSMT